MPDYDKLLDQQTKLFIEQTNNWYPPATIDFTIERQRQIYNDMCREFHHGYPDGVNARDGIIASGESNIPVRRYHTDYSNTATRIIYFHGGGFVVGGLESHDDVCAEICERTGLSVTAVDYRLAPEHLHPAAFNDSLSAVLHECKEFNQQIILCGDSAGGNLAAAVSHWLRDNSHPDVIICGQVLIYPALDDCALEQLSGSYQTHADAPMLTTRDVKFYTTIRTGDKDIDNIVTLAPLKDANFSDLPETVVFSAECDPVCDDGEHYCQAISKAGGAAQVYIEKGMVHGYLRARHSVDRARQSFDRIIESLLAFR